MKSYWQWKHKLRSKSGKTIQILEFHDKVHIMENIYKIEIKQIVQKMIWDIGEENVEEINLKTDLTNNNFVPKIIRVEDFF